MNTFFSRIKLSSVRILSGAALLGAVLGVSSCNKYLDIDPTDKISDVVIWNDTESAEYAVNYIYSYLYDIAASYQCAAGMTEALTDEFKYGSYVYNSLCYIPSEIAYGGSVLTANYVDVYLGCWGSLYSALFKTNEALSNLSNSKSNFSDDDYTRLRAELCLVRGWINFELVKRYKDIIIYDEDIDSMAKDRALDTEKEAWDFIVEDLEYAQTYLPEKANASGRLDKGMAYAFTTRAMLYAERYDKVIEAAEKVESLGYSLMDEYADSYTTAINAGNTEAIFQYTFSYSDGITHSFDTYYTPGGDFALISQIGGGYGTPTQEMVESYELAAGGFPDWSAWHTGEATTATPPYAELEPRFQATILYNGAEWKGRTIEPFVNGTDGWCEWRVEASPKGRTTTGYYLRKGVDETHDLSARAESVQPLTILRYGEVLLNKAEACYFTGDASGANAAIKEIRSRVGLPTSTYSGDNLWNAIRQERKVELAYEGLYYWDLRRWEVSANAYPDGLEGYQCHGFKIEKTPAGAFQYTYVSVDDQDRHFPSKMYRFPLPSGELSSNSAVTQYSEWL